MKKQKHILKHACDWVDIPIEIATDETRITMPGRNKVWVENHKGLRHYDAEQISFAANGYEIVISGKKLQLEKSDLGCALVQGIVFSISCRGEGERDG